MSKAAVVRTDLSTGQRTETFFRTVPSEDGNGYGMCKEEHKKFAELLTISKNKNIAEWAKDMVHNYEKEILTQRKREEEEKFLFQ